MKMEVEVEEEEEEERRVRLEKRLETNVDFDDALQVLDSTVEQPWMAAILYRVGVNTHKELDLEDLMTLAPVINEGVSCLSFRLED
jgi:hypothetical protein